MTLRIALFVLLSSMCAFGKITTRDMYNDCKTARRIAEHARLNTDSDYDMGVCTGYTLGFWSGLIIMQGSLFDSGVEHVSADALGRSLINYVDAHPAAIDDDDGLDLNLVKAWIADGILEVKKGGKR
jgi:hypothetical protein